jgi:hypothetical protein
VERVKGKEKRLKGKRDSRKGCSIPYFGITLVWL